MVSPRSAAAAASTGGDGTSGGEMGGGKEKDGSESSKRPPPSSASPPVAPPTKRGKVEVEAVAMAAPAGKKNSGPSAEEVSAWAYMLSQSPGTPHVPIHCKEISVGKGDNCHICLDGEYVGENLCLLRHLEQGGPCEVTSDVDHVEVNGKEFLQGDRVILRGGDEVIFGRSGKHAYIFQHPLRDNEVTGAVPTVSVPTQSAEENKQTVVESATLPPSKRSFKDVLKQGILSPADIRVTFVNFPYYVSGTTKRMLLSSAFIHMEKEFRKCLYDISSLNQRILLSGPSGSEIYQEELIKALAKHFNARLLILDSRMLYGTSSMFQESPKDVKGDDAPTFREGDMVEYIGHDLFKLRTRSDLKNLCVCAAHCPIHEIVEKEKKEKSLALAEGKPDPPLYGGEAIRPLRMDDFKFALGQVRVSFLPDSSGMDKRIEEWNNKFGDGGSGSEAKQTLSYYM